MGDDAQDCNAHPVWFRPLSATSSLHIFFLPLTTYCKGSCSGTWTFMRFAVDYTNQMCVWFFFICDILWWTVKIITAWTSLNKWVGYNVLSHDEWKEKSHQRLGSLLAITTRGMAVLVNCGSPEFFRRKTEM